MISTTANHSMTSASGGIRAFLLLWQDTWNLSTLDDWKTIEVFLGSLSESLLGLKLLSQTLLVKNALLKSIDGSTHVLIKIVHSRVYR